MGDEDQTRAHKPEALLEDSLAATLDLLRDLQDSPEVRDLRARAETYRRTIDRWGAVRPSAEQRAALRELVSKLNTRATEVHASGRVPPTSKR